MRGYHADMSVYVEDAFIGALFVQFGQDELLHPKHNAVLTADGDGRATPTHTQEDALLQQYFQDTFLHFGSVHSLSTGQTVVLTRTFLATGAPTDGAGDGRGGRSAGDHTPTLHHYVGFIILFSATSLEINHKRISPYEFKACACWLKGRQRSARFG